MKLAITLLLATGLGIGCGAGAQPVTNSAASTPTLEYANAREAAEALLELMDMDSLMSSTIDTTIDLQIKGNPSLGQFREIMITFMNKHMGWAAIADEMTQLYVDAYEHSELEDLVRFYRTPTGAKSVKLIPQLMKEGGELGVRRVQENTAELEAMIKESIMKDAQSSPGQ